jgi:hypothetical protein
MLAAKAPGSLAGGLPVQFEAGQRVQVFGWFESREFEYTLSEFLSNVVHDPGARQIVVNRNVVADSDSSRPRRRGGSRG